MDNQVIQLLLVEDSPDDAWLLQEALTETRFAQFEVTHVEQVSEALKNLEARHFNAVLLDLGLPDSQGFETFMTVHGRHPQLPILVMTGLDDEDLAIKAMQDGAQDYLVKGEVEGNLLARAIRYAIERKNTEGKLRTFAAKLERSNRDLEEFASVVSHDLQEPLRKIRTFTEQLVIECHDVLPDQARDYLERIENASRRMQTLIKELLEYSRLTTETQPCIPVNLSEVTREVLEDLEARIQETRGRVEVDDLSTIEAAPLHMRQLLQNLISNALKFHHPDVAPVVRVYSPKPQGPVSDRVEIRVEDNGIGFEEKHLERIFEPFVRLHGRSHFEGSGVGLATCRKIVELYGGVLTARSTPGQGATFIATLPLRPLGLLMSSRPRRE